MKKKTIEFPTEWEEVQPREWLYLCKIFFRMIENPQITLLDIKRDFVRFVLANRNLKQKGSLEYYHLVQQLTETLDWIFIEADGKVAINFNSTVNLLPKWENFFGPADHGADLTFGEFRLAMQMMNTYTISHQEIYLTYLCGVLYRRRKHGEREPFDVGQLNTYTFRAARIPQFVRYAVYLWLASFSKFLLEGTFVIDGNEVCFADIFGKNTDESTAKSLGMNSILYSMAESGIFGTIDDVDKAPLLKVLMKLLDDKYKLDAIQKQAKERE